MAEEQLIYTREQYRKDHREAYAKGLDTNLSHRKYYGQFVRQSTIDRVVRAIGREALLKDRDPHLNGIPLRKWDALVPGLPGSDQFKAAGDFYTISGGVCLAKEAARQYIERERTREGA